MQPMNGNDLPTQDVEPHALRDPEKQPRELTIPNATEEINTAPQTEEAHLQKWNSPRINTFHCFATFWSSICLGANDGAYGVRIPYLERYYDINYTIVSPVFLSPIVGYTCSAIFNNAIHVRFG